MNENIIGKLLDAAERLGIANIERVSLSNALQSSHGDIVENRRVCFV